MSNFESKARKYVYTSDLEEEEIFSAIRQNDPNTLRELLKKCKRNRLIFRRVGERTALHVAASQPECMECVALLLDYKKTLCIDIDEPTFNDREIYGRDKTALFIACEEGCEKSVELLLKRGANTLIRTSQNETALSVAVSKGRLNIVKSLLEYPQNINERANGVDTLLHISARCGHLEISRILLENGADTRLFDRCYNQLPLHVACEKGHFDIAHLLLNSYPATINYQDYFGFTPLMRAMSYINPENVRIFLEKGARLDICDNYGNMAVHHAALRGNAQVLQFLLQSTSTSYIEQWTSNSDGRGNCRFRSSLTSCAFANLECLQVLVSSELSKDSLQMPYVNDALVATPLAALFLFEKSDEKLTAFLPLLLNHKIAMSSELFRPIACELVGPVCFSHPYEFFIYSWMYNRSRFLEQWHNYDLLKANDITIDYCFQCFYDLSQPFSTFIKYAEYYRPITSALEVRGIEIAKLMVSDSVILEPDIIFTVYSTQMNECDEELCDFYRYLVSLKPMYFLKAPLLDQTLLRLSSQCLPLKSVIKEEFAKITLQQLCRTVIRHHVRDYTLEDNLRNFKRKIMALPLPEVLKKYLLFKPVISHSWEQNFLERNSQK